MRIVTSTIYQGSYQDQSLSNRLESSTETLSSPQDGSDVFMGTQSQRSDYTARYYGKSESHISQNEQVTTLTLESELTANHHSELTEDVVLMEWRGGNDGEDPEEWIHNKTTHVYEENQRLIFESVGEVLTEDGRTIDYMLQLDFQHELVQTSERETLRNAREWRDPLIISLTGQIPTISNGSFEFDLNSDGSNEQLKHLGAGMGYIAFDKNNDGEINDGSELFGANTGQGFAELAQYDSDGNGWIDENDDIYSKLKVWQPDQDALISFAEAEVGAIYLNADHTEYTFTKNDGDADARITQSSVALKENGQAVGVFQLEWAQENTIQIDGVTFAVTSAAELQIATSSQFTIQPAAVVTANDNNGGQSTQGSQPQNIQTQGFVAAAAYEFSEMTSTQYSETFSRSVQQNPDNGPIDTQNNRYQSQVSEPKETTETDSPNIHEYDESKDEKIIQLRAVIEALKDMRESNQRQQDALEKKLIIGE